MVIAITDNERRVMANAIDQTVIDLEATSFNTDPLVTEFSSRCTSQISSIYKRHGKLLELAIFTAINTDSNWSALKNERLPVSDGSKREIDLIVQNIASKNIMLIEIKRGFGKHDTDAIRGINERLSLVRSEFEKILESKKIRTIVLSVYGEVIKVKPPHEFWELEDFDTHFRSGITTFLSELNDYLSYRINKSVEPLFLEAYRELREELGSPIGDIYLKKILDEREIREHVWDKFLDT